MLAGVTGCRRSQKWGCKGRWALGFKPRCGSHRERGPRGSEGEEGRPRGFGEEGRETCSFCGVNRRGPCGFGVLLFATRLRQLKRLCSHRKRGERTLAGGLWHGLPHGFGLTGDCGSHTTDGAGSLNHGLLLLFLRYGTPDWAEGEGRTVHLWVF